MRPLSEMTGASFFLLMPYSGANDADLPDKIKKLPAKKRRQFVHVWNSAYGNCRNPKIGAAGSAKKCEGVAFRFAYGAVKETDMEEEGKAEIIAVKVGDKEPRPVKELTTEELEAAYRELGGEEDKQIEAESPVADLPLTRPLGGATTFAEADANRETQEEKEFSRSQEDTLRSLFDNIMADEEKTLEGKASAVAKVSQELGDRIRNGPEGQRGLMEKVKDFLGLKRGKGEKAVGRHMLGTFQAFKDLSGDWRWLSWTTNRFKDREGEIFTEKSHEEYVARVDEQEKYPELWLWHIDGSRVGQADFVGYQDGFVLHSGVFDDDKQDVAERLSESKGLAVSHGFFYEPGDEEDGVYDWYETFEVSVLPAERAANAYTEFAVDSKEEKSMLTAEKRQFLVEKWGEDRTVELEGKLGSLSGELKEAGIEFKDLVAGEPEAPEAEGEDSEASTGEDSEDEAETPEALTVEGVRRVVQEIFAPIEERLAATEKALEGKADADRVATLERSDDEKIADQLAPRRRAPGNGERPSQSKDTEAPDEVVDEVTKETVEDPIEPFFQGLVGGRVTQEGGTIHPPPSAEG